MQKSVAIGTVLLWVASYPTMVVAEGRPGNGSGAGAAARLDTPTLTVSPAGIQSGTGQTLDKGTPLVGSEGQLGATHSIPLDGTWSLEMGAGFDLEQQSTPNPVGSLNGRLGLGFKY